MVTLESSVQSLELLPDCYRFVRLPQGHWFKLNIEIFLGGGNNKKYFFLSSFFINIYLFI